MIGAPTLTQFDTVVVDMASARNSATTGPCLRFILSHRGIAWEVEFPKVNANDIIMNYEQQGTDEPLILVPYLAADNACYAFQVADYAKQFTCISIDPRGAGDTDMDMRQCSQRFLP